MIGVEQIDVIIKFVPVVYVIANLFLVTIMYVVVN